MSDDNRRPLTDLVFLRHAQIAVRVAVVVIAAVATGGAGTALARLQLHFAAQLVPGARLGAIATLLARGSGVATAAAPWVAAALFATAVLRLRRDPLEPAPSLRPAEAQSPAQLRRGLRREYTAIRVALTVLLLVTALDLARVVTLLGLVRHPSVALNASLLAAAVEACGLAVASIVLAWWAHTFATRLENLGAL